MLSEWRATLIVRESACLDVEDRARLDAELCADPTRLEGKGDERIAADAKAIAYRLDPHAVVDRAVRAETERSVTVRPAPDCMTYVTALLPMTQGVAVYAAAQTRRRHLLRRPLPRPGHGRHSRRARHRPTRRGAHPDRGQPRHLRRHPARGGHRAGAPHRIRARTRRGGPQARPNRRLRPSIQSHPAQALQTPGLRRRWWPWNPGHGASHAGWPRSSPPATTRARTPYCDAPIRHIDHATPAARGGPTTADNGRGTCAACNYAKEAGGWLVTTATHENGVHTTELTTPTGTRYRSTAPPLPGPITVSQVEMNIGISIARHAA